MIRTFKNLSLVFYSLLFLYQDLKGQVPGFTMPASACVNAPVNIVNASTGGSSFYWSFCSADLLQVPQAVNLGIINPAIQEPVFIEIVKENGNYYGLVTSDYPGNLVRLDFGNSLLNTPVSTALGNFGGIIPADWGQEGLQVVNSNGRWYAILVGGTPASSSSPKIIKIDFGSSITNPTPVATDWGNLGNLLFPVQVYMFQQGGNWYGYTVNSENNTITRFDFGANLNNPPVAVNLGNPGGLLNYPCGIYAANDGGFWRVFISNGGHNISNALVRLDFGNSLLNSPTAVNLGNPGNVIGAARALTILQTCDQTVGFLTDGLNASLVRLDFNNNLSNIPTVVSLGNLAGWAFPHSLSKLFRVGADLYSFVPDAFKGTLTRLRFAGCTNASIPNSSNTDPPAVSWSQPGTYRVSLIMDDGLATQATSCQTINVKQTPDFSLGRDTGLCEGQDLVLRYNGIPASLVWGDGSIQDTFAIHSAGQYSLTAAVGSCATTHSVNVSYAALPVLNTLPDTAICVGSSIVLATSATPADWVSWSPGTSLSDPGAVSPIAAPTVSSSYIVTAAHGQCLVKDTLEITVRPLPAMSIQADTVICVGGKASLQAAGADVYQWYPTQGLSDPAIANPLAIPDSSRYYFVKGKNGYGCTSLDSTHIRLKPPDIFTVGGWPLSICPGDSSVLKAVGAELSLGDSYTWSVPAGLADPYSPVQVVSPKVSTDYQVVGVDKLCDVSSTLSVHIDVRERPDVTVTKSNDINCVYGEASLTATGGVRYSWTPVETLSDPFSSTPVARTGTPTLYSVVVTGSNGCSTTDSILVAVAKDGLGIGFPVANAFTPNGDGHNDCFGLKYWGYVGGFEMSIYNRWGVLVFQSSNPGDCWDGTYKGIPQPAGTYIYMIRAAALCGMAFRKGIVELIR